MQVSTALTGLALPATKLFAAETRSSKKAEPTPAAAAAAPSVNYLAPFTTHIFNRCAYGPRPGDYAQFASLGQTDTQRFSKWLDQQLHPEQVKDVDCERYITNAKLTTLTKTLEQLHADHVVAADNIRDQNKIDKKDDKKENRNPAKVDAKTPMMIDENHLRQLPIIELEIATWLKAVYSERQLNEVLVEFWHDHFNIFGWENRISPTFVHFDRDVIRKNAFGNFREMLEDTAKSPSMLLYLDNFVNQSGNPNENYARELFELHTLGAEHYLGTKNRESVAGYKSGKTIGYVDGDVYEAARCFTGWRIDQGNKTNNTGQFEYYEPWHDRFQKIVLGHKLPEYESQLKDGHTVLDVLAHHPATAKHIALKLCRRFVSDDPPAALVERTAKVFSENVSTKDQLRQVLKSILLSDDFKKSQNQKFKRPFEFATSTIRAAQLDFFPSAQFLNNYEKSGQKRFQWRSPDGYPDIAQKWLSSGSIFERWKLINQMFVAGLDQIKFEVETFFGRAGVDVELTKKLNADLEPVVQKVAQHSLNRDLASHQAKAINTVLGDSKNLKNKRAVGAAVALLYMTPEFQWR